jgi:type I restriction enzyme S subunit
MSRIKKQLPDGWVMVHLGDIAAKITDGSHNPPRKQQSGFRMISARNVRHGEIDFDNIRFINERDFQKEHQRTSIQPGDILLTIVGTIGRSAVVPDNLPSFTAQRSVAIIKPILVNSKYLHNQFQSQSFQAKFIDRAKGSAQKGVYLKTLSMIPVLIAPLKEQERIVEKVEKLLAAIVKVKEQLANIPGILKRFRQSALSDAITGKLTQTLRNKNKFNYDNKQTLIFDIDLPTGWKKIKVRDFTSKVGSGATPKGGQRVYVLSGTPLIRSQNVHFEGFVEEGLVFINQKHAKKLTNVEVQEDDVLLNITGASIGRVATAPKPMNGARVNQHVCIIRPNKLIQPSFLSYFLASPEMQRHIMQSQYGVTRQALTKTQILDFEVPLPHKEEQKEIVRFLDSLFALADNIESRYQNAIKKVNEVSQNILTKAFCGELVITEAELAKKERRSYETAEELLSRIKFERERLSKHKTKRKIMKKIKNKIQDITADKLAVILLRSQTRKLSPDQLFSKAGFDENSVDQFYELLRDCVAQKRIIETRTKDNHIFLEGVG